MAQKRVTTFSKNQGLIFGVEVAKFEGKGFSLWNLGKKFLKKQPVILLKKVF